MTLDNLTQLQKTAIEGEVAKALSTARHNPEILYRIYIISRNAPEAVKPYVSEIVKELVGINPLLLKRVALEALAEEVPIWLWVEKAVADIKLSIKLAVMDGMICDVEADKKLMQKKIVKSSFVFFVRRVATVCTKAAKDLCRYIIEKEGLELDFLEDVCFTLMAEIDELEPTEVMSMDAFHSEFDIRDLLSYKLETDIIEKHSEVPEEPVEIEEIGTVEDGDTQAVAFKIDLPKDFKEADINKIMKEILCKSKKPKENKTAKYAVTKEYSNSPVSTTLKTFETEAEAESYKEQLEKGYPELMKSCTIKIKKVKG